MVNRGNELIRVSPKECKKTEYSTNQGRTWMIRYNGSPTSGHSVIWWIRVKKFSKLPTKDYSIQSMKEETEYYEDAINTDKYDNKTSFKWNYGENFQWLSM